MSTSRLPALLATAAAVVATDAAGAPLQRIKLLPMGTTVLRDGRGPFHIADLAAANRIVAASLAEHGDTDIPIDYDHQIVRAAEGKGGRAEAAGWVTNLEAASDGLYATVAWTAEAAGKLAARAYRYVSPVFHYDKAGNVLAIHSAAILNKPAITALPAIAAGATLENDSMKTIAAALGLAEDASEADILAAIAASKAVPAGDIAAAAATLGLASGATLGQVVAAAAKVEVLDPKKHTSTDEVTALTGALAKINSERAEIAVAAAQAKGKLIPAQRDRMIKHFIADEADWREWEKTAPVIVAAGALVPGDKPKFDGTPATLDAAQLAVCAQMGVTHEQFIAAMPKEA